MRQPLLGEFCLQRFHAAFQFFVLKRLLRELNNVLRRSDTDILVTAVEVFHQGLGRFGNIGLETVQGLSDDLITLAF